MRCCVYGGELGYYFQEIVLGLFYKQLIAKLFLLENVAN